MGRQVIRIQREAKTRSTFSDAIMKNGVTMQVIASLAKARARQNNVMVRPR